MCDTSVTILALRPQEETWVPRFDWLEMHPYEGALFIWHLQKQTPPKRGLNKNLTEKGATECCGQTSAMFLTFGAPVSTVVIVVPSADLDIVTPEDADV